MSNLDEFSLKSCQETIRELMQMKINQFEKLQKCFEVRCQKKSIQFSLEITKARKKDQEMFPKLFPVPR